MFNIIVTKYRGNYEGKCFLPCCKFGLKKKRELGNALSVVGTSSTELNGFVTIQNSTFTAYWTHQKKLYIQIDRYVLYATNKNIWTQLTEHPVFKKRKNWESSCFRRRDIYVWVFKLKCKYTFYKKHKIWIFHQTYK